MNGTMLIKSGIKTAAMRKTCSKYFNLCPFIANSKRWITMKRISNLCVNAPALTI
jgi:hypothetical protein